MLRIDHPRVCELFCSPQLNTLHWHRCFLLAAYCLLLTLYALRPALSALLLAGFAWLVFIDILHQGSRLKPQGDHNPPTPSITHLDLPMMHINDVLYHR